MTGRAVGVVGASARAAAMSLVRAGFEPWAVDLFADRDLRRVAPVVRCPLADYPAALPDLAEQFPPGPVLYTGGLENHPEVVAELARRRELWGVGPDVLRTVRQPAAAEVAADGFDVAHARSAADPVPATGRWLAKPTRSSGGLGVRFAEPGEVLGPGHFLQEFIPGPALSAQFVTLAGVTSLLGVTEQLVGEGWLHARPFGYGGNVGPAGVSGELCAGLAGYADRLARGHRLRGVWGIDFVLRHGRAVPIEVNPRYTAAMEVLELASGTPVFARPAPPTPPRLAVAAKRPASSHPSIGKAVYYAPHPLTFPASGPWDADLTGPFDPWRVPGFADIPAAGEPIEPGHPVLTFFAAGSTPDDCRAKLKVRAAELDALFAAGQQP